MKKILTYAVATLLASSLLSAGGKVVAPVEAPVTPVPPAPAKISPIPVYVGLGLIAAGVSRDCACKDGERLKDLTYGSILRLGYDFNNYIGIEARVLKSFIEKDFSEVTHYGLFLKPQYHLSKQSNLYALVGYGKTKATGCTVTGDLDKSGLSYGVGFEYDFGSDTPENGVYDRPFDGQGDQEQGWGMWVDFQHMLNNEGVFNVKANVVTFGVTYDF